MESIFGIIVSVGFFGLIFVIIAWAGKSTLTKIEKYYKAIAEKFGLTYIPEKKLWIFITKYPMLSGSLGDYQFMLYSYTTGGKNKTTYTQAKVFLNSTVTNISIYKEGFFSNIGKKFGMQDVIVGNQELDSAFIFKSKDEAFITRVMQDPEVSQMLLHLKNEMKAGIYLNNGLLTYTEVNHINNENKQIRFEKIITLLYALAIELEK